MATVLAAREAGTHMRRARWGRRLAEHRIRHLDGTSDLIVCSADLFQQQRRSRVRHPAPRRTLPPRTPRDQSIFQKPKVSGSYSTGFCGAFPFLFCYYSIQPDINMLHLLILAAASGPVYLDPAAPIDARVADLVAKLSLTDLIQQTWVRQCVHPATPSFDVAVPSDCAVGPTRARGGRRHVRGRRAWSHR